MKRSAKKKVLPSYVFKKISGVKHRITCYGCGVKFTTLHSAKKYCDDCLNRTKKAEELEMRRQAAAKRRAAAKKRAGKRKAAKKPAKKKVKKVSKKPTKRKPARKRSARKSR